jgi:hypothetical protein
MLVVVGGGCYGSYHTRQLLKAVRAGAAGLAGERLVVVDRNPSCLAAREFAGATEVSVAASGWREFLRSWLGPGPDAARPSDWLVPAPLAPHLLWDWLAGELGAERAPAPAGWRLPYERPGAGGVRYLSAAGWTCPATCVEPAHCPALHAPRDWDLAMTIEERARAEGCRPAVFRCLHLAHGVGAIRAADLLAARSAATREPEVVLVATTSRCHAAVGLLRSGGTG